MILYTLINAVVLMAILMAIGYYLRNKKVLTDDAEGALTYILVNITTPAMLINALNIKFSIDQFKTGMILFAVSFIFNFLLVALGKITSLKLHNDGKKIIFKYAIVYLNGGFMGFPIVNQLFGAQGMFYATMFHFPNTILMWTLGTSIFLGKNKDKNRIKNIFVNPGMLGIYGGLILYFTQITLPPFASNLLSLLTNATTFLSMIIIGNKIAKIGIKQSFSDLDAYYATFVRLVISPIIMIALLKLFIFESMAEQVFVIYASLPVAALMPILALKYGRDDRFGSKVVVINHLLSLVTIPIFFWLYSII